MPTQFPQPTFWLLYGDRILLVSFGLLCSIACGLVIWKTFVGKTALRWIPVMIFATVASLLTPLIMPVWNDTYRYPDHEADENIALTLMTVNFVCGIIGLAWYSPDSVIIRLTIHSRNAVSNATSTRRVGMALIALAAFMLVFSLIPEVRSGFNSMAGCQRNLTNIGYALAKSADNSPDRRFPNAAEGQPRVSWPVTILPYLGSHNFSNDLYHTDAEWDDKVNDEAAQTYVRDLKCWDAKSSADSRDRYFTSYAMITGPGTNSRGGRRAQMMTSDVTSHSAIVIEACGRNIVWTEPRDVSISVESIGFNQPGTTPNESPSIGSSTHWKGVNTLMADGSVRCLPLKTDPKVLKALMTADGAENEK